MCRNNRLGHPETDGPARCWKRAARVIQLAFVRQLVGRSQNVVLARFFSDGSNRLASAGKDGQLFVWRIGEDEGPIFAQQLLSVRVAGVASATGSGLRLAWDTTSQDLIAFSGGSTVYLASVQRAGAEGNQVNASLPHAAVDVVLAVVQQMLCISTWCATPLSAQSYTQHALMT